MVQKLAARYGAEGEAAFEPRSRRPRTSPHRLAAELEAEIVALRETLAEEGLDAGAATIAAHRPLAMAGLRLSPRSGGCWARHRRLLRAGFVCLVDGMDIDALVVRDGDCVAAAGRLVRNSQGDWFEPAFWIAEPGGLERRVRPVWQGAIRVVGANFDTLSRRFEWNGAVEGWALLTGTWSRGQLEVEQQDDPPPRSDPPVRWVTPPCPSPPGGWPVAIRRGDAHLDYDLGDLLETGAAVAITLFQPGQDQAVLVVAASDVPAVDARLRPQLGELLCIVPSRWTKTVLDAVRGHLDVHREQWNLLQWGPQNTADGQTQVAARLVRVLPEIADWAASLPNGLVLLEPWLTPLRAEAESRPN